MFVHVDEIIEFSPASFILKRKQLDLDPGYKQISGNLDEDYRWYLKPSFKSEISEFHKLRVLNKIPWDLINR